MYHPTTDAVLTWLGLLLMGVGALTVLELVIAAVGAVADQVGKLSRGGVTGLRSKRGVVESARRRGE